MFVVRSKSGMIFTSTAWDETNGKELEYETVAEAEKEIETYRDSFPNQKFYIHELNVVGRPSIGITKKVSLTLSESNWEWLDEKAKGNRSKFLREIVWNALGNEAEWSNNAAYGYMILAAEELNMDQEQISNLRKAMCSHMDRKTVDEAKDAYINSSY